MCIRDRLKEVVNRLGDYVYGIDISSLQQAVVTHLKQKGLHIAVAEACSGTPLTQKLNMVPGAGAVFEFGVSAYANRVKHEVLKVPEKLIKKFGAVSDQVAVHMACGAMDAGSADIGVAVTGVMGPQADGGRPVGLVYIAVCNKDSVVVRKLSLSPERSPAELQDQAAMHALNLVRLILDYDPEPYPGAVPLGAALKGKAELCDEAAGAAAAVIPEAGRRAKGARKAAGPGRRRWYHVILPCKGDGAFDVIRKLLVIVFLGVFVGSSIYIGSYYYERFATKSLYQSLADLIDSGKDPGDVDGYPEEYQPKFAAYWEQNRDFKGWLSIDGTQVNYPVVQAADNDYYLRRDFERKDNQHGVPFLDYEVELDPQSDNAIIYGHNMKDGQMFGELLGYKDVEYLKEHPIIHFDNVYENADYKVAAVFLASTEQDHGPKFRYEQFVNAASDEEFMDFVDQIQMRSMINTGVDIEEGDKLLTLSTCSYEFWEARFVVVGRKVRDDEDSEVDTSKIEVNPEPLMPDVYYEVTKSQKPAKYEGMGAWAPSNSKSRTTPMEIF